MLGTLKKPALIKGPIEQATSVVHRYCASYFCNTARSKNLTAWEKTDHVPRDDAATCLEFQASSLYFNPDGNDIHSKARPGCEKPRSFKKFAGQKTQYLDTLGILSTAFNSSFFKMFQAWKQDG